MDRKQTPGEHWDREQMERDTTGVPEDVPQAEVWNRHQMETDDGSSAVDAETLDQTDEDDALAAGGLSGRGQPSGESHWDRVDHGDRDQSAG